MGGVRAGFAAGGLGGERPAADTQSRLSARGDLHSDQRHALEADAAGVSLFQDGAQAF